MRPAGLGRLTRLLTLSTTVDSRVLRRNRIPTVQWSDCTQVSVVGCVSYDSAEYGTASMLLLLVNAKSRFLIHTASVRVCSFPLRDVSFLALSSVASLSDFGSDFKILNSKVELG